MPEYDSEQVKTDPDPYLEDPNPPYRSELTVIWKEEKQAIHDRLDIHAKSIEALMQRVQVLEAWALQLRREPTAFTKEPSEQSDLEAKTANAFKSAALMMTELSQRLARVEQCLGAGLITPVSPGVIRRTTAVHLPPEVTKYVPDPEKGA